MFHVHTEHKSYACALTYVPCRILLQLFSLGTRPHKSQMYIYDPAMARLAGPVPAPLLMVLTLVPRLFTSLSMRLDSSCLT